MLKIVSMKYIRLIAFFCLPLYMLSCKPQQRLPAYLENRTDTTGMPKAVVIPELKIQKNDLLSIRIYSIATDPKTDMVYNQEGAAAAAGGTQGGGSTGGYLVDVHGNIEHHRLGSIHAEGLTKLQLAAEIKKRLTDPVELLKDPTVIIRFLNFKISVLGEVGVPGSIPVQGERITILEAISLAGDITQYGRKNTVQVIREIDGQRTRDTIDLSSDKLFDSPYYNLLQNDVVLVEASKAKTKSAEQAAIAQKVSFALAIVTSAATIASIFIRN